VTTATATDLVHGHLRRVPQALGEAAPLPPLERRRDRLAEPRVLSGAEEQGEEAKKLLQDFLGRRDRAPVEKKTCEKSENL